MTKASDEEVIPVNTLNEYAIGSGQNMENTTFAARGRAKFVRQMRSDVPTFRTKQEAYRYAAYLVTMADLLPDEDGEHTYEQVLEAVQNA